MHTKGPWVFRGPSRPTADTPRGGDYAIVSDGAIIAEAFAQVAPGDYGERPADANARLIAAAPDLLEALKVIMDGFASGVFVRDVTRDAESSWAVRLLPFIKALGDAKAAIAKATQP